MLKILYAILIILINVSLYSQSTEMIVPFYNNGKWGFMNKNKDIIVCPKYEEAYPSITDRYRVKIKGKYGYINRVGKLVIKSKYDEAEDFRYGIAEVKRKGKSKTIDEEGKNYKVTFGRCGNHSCARPRLSRSLKIIEANNKLGIVHKKITSDTIYPVFDSIGIISSQLLYLVKDSLISFSHEGSYWSGVDYVIDNLNFEYEDIKLFDCNFCSSGKDEIVGVKKSGLWGYKNIHSINKIFVIPKYLEIDSLADGFALVEYEDAKFGYIDDKGNEYFIR